MMGEGRWMGGRQNEGVHAVAKEQKMGAGRRKQCCTGARVEVHGMAWHVEGWRGVGH